MTAASTWGARKLHSLAALANAAALLLQFFSAFVISWTVLQRGNFSELSRQFYGANVPLMDSPAADLIVGPVLLVAVSAVLAASIWKEVKVGSLRRRIAINVALLGALTGLHASLTFLLFRPALG